MEVEMPESFVFSNIKWMVGKLHYKGTGFIMVSTENDAVEISTVFEVVVHPNSSRLIFRGDLGVRSLWTGTSK